jgi:hypothetical protein
LAKNCLLSNSFSSISVSSTFTIDCHHWALFHSWDIYIHIVIIFNS